MGFGILARDAEVKFLDECLCRKGKDMTGSKAVDLPTHCIAAKKGPTPAYVRESDGRSLCRICGIDEDEQSFLSRSDDAPCNYHYLALSYCWSGEQRCRLLESNMKDFERNISWFSLPSLCGGPGLQ